MSHFAKVFEGKVIKVIVCEEDFFDVFVDDSPGEWIQTSYNTRGGIHYQQDENGAHTIESEDQSKALRYNFAGIGFNYDKEADAFYAEKPYDSWTLNTETYLWEPPVAYPNDGGYYKWNEEDQQWDSITE